jgi:hypothetical protein
MFREALGYPTRAPEGGRSVIAGGLLLVSITICFGIGSLDTPYAYAAVVGLFPWLLVRGYYVRVIRTTIGRSRPTPPRFDDVRRLLADGTTAVGIAIIYLFPGAVILGPLVGIQVFEADLSELLTAAGVTEAAVAVLIPVVGFVAVVALMSLLGALYVLPVAVGRFAHSGEWRSAIELRTVIGGALTEDYAIAWGVSFVLRVLLIGFFLHFIVAVGVRYCYGQGVGSALDLDAVGDDRAATDADETGSESDGELRPAFTRVGTEQWGISPGEDGEPMRKSARFDASEESQAETEKLPSSAERTSDDESTADR